MIASCSPGAERVAVSPVSRDERLQVRPRELAQVEARENGVAEIEEPQREPVAPVSATCSTNRAAASVASRRDTVLALIPVRRAISFVPSSPPSDERVEHGERALDGGDVADGWLSGSGHGTLLVVRF